MTKLVDVVFLMDRSTGMCKTVPNALSAVDITDGLKPKTSDQYAGKAGNQGQPTQQFPPGTASVNSIREVIEAAGQSCGFDLRAWLFHLGEADTIDVAPHPASGIVPLRSTLLAQGVPASELIEAKDSFSGGSSETRPAPGSPTPWGWADEDASAALLDLVRHHPWRPHAERVVLYMGDEGLFAGDAESGGNTAASLANDQAETSIVAQEARGRAVRISTFYWGPNLGTGQEPGQEATNVSTYAGLANYTFGLSGKRAPTATASDLVSAVHTWVKDSICRCLKVVLFHQRAVARKFGSPNALTGFRSPEGAGAQLATQILAAPAIDPAKSPFVHYPDQALRPPLTVFDTGFVISFWTTARPRADHTGTYGPALALLGHDEVQFASSCATVLETWNLPASGYQSGPVVCAYVHGVGVVADPCVVAAGGGTASGWLPPPNQTGLAVDPYGGDILVHVQALPVVRGRRFLGWIAFGDTGHHAALPHGALPQARWTRSATPPDPKIRLDRGQRGLAVAVYG